LDGLAGSGLTGFDDRLDERLDRQVVIACEAGNEIERIRASASHLAHDSQTFDAGLHDRRCDVRQHQVDGRSQITPASRRVCSCFR